MSELTTAGYQVLPEIFSSVEIEGMGGAIMDTMDRVARSLRAPFEMSCPSSELANRLDEVWRKDRAYAQALFRAALADCHRDERIVCVASHARLTPRIAEFIAPLKSVGQTIRARASVASFEVARTRWHQDVVYPANQGCGSVRLACWIPLMDVDEESGALEVMPGSWSGPLPHDGEPDGRFFIAPESLPATDRRAIPLQRGDVLVLDRFIPHRSLPVHSASARWSIVMWIKTSTSDAC